MAKTSAERQRLFVERHSQDADFKKRQAERKQKWRSNRQVTRSVINKDKRAETERKRKYRLKCKQQIAAGVQSDSVGETPCTSRSVDLNTPSKAFKSAASLGKAVRRVSRFLPQSPGKKAAVVRKLAISTSLFGPARGQSNALKIPNKTVEQVQEFFQRDDISRQAPGMKDAILVRDGTTKKRVQKRHLTMTVQEAYKCFCNDNPNLIIGKSKFSELRPKHVLLSSQTPTNACLCRYHENINLLLQGLHGKLPDVFPLKTTDLIVNSVCNPDSEICMFGSCDKCGNLLGFERGIGSKFNNDDDEPIETKWYSWDSIDGKQQKVLKEGLIDECMDVLRAQLPKFLQHDFIKKKQSSVFQSLKSSVDMQTGLLQMDFSENYTASYQDEIQSAHWHQKQITVFTAVLWIAERCESYAIISDSLDHNKEAVCAFLCKILDDVQEKYPAIKKIHIFTDGAASQFKNKYIFCFICVKLPALYDIHISWDFFATSHGKGAVDGIGGTIKRTVAAQVNSRQQAVVNDAATFLAVAKSRCPKINVLMVSKDDIKTFSEKHDLESLWLSACSIPGTQNIHSLVVISESMAIRSKTYSTSDVHVTHQFGAVSRNDTAQESDSETIILEPSSPTPASPNNGIQLSDIISGNYIPLYNRTKRKN